MNNSKRRLRFTGSCLKEDFKTFTANNVVNTFIVQRLDRWPQDLNSKFTLKDYLFGNAEVTKNAHPNKYSYSVCEIGFDFHLFFSVLNFDQDKNVVLFGVDRCSSVHANNRNKNILILVKRQTYGLDGTALTVKSGILH